MAMNRILAAVYLLLLFSSAYAQGGGNSACAEFCAATFGDTAQAGHCTSAAAHDQATSPCSMCGPAAPQGHPEVCGTGTTSARCCPSGTPTCCSNSLCVNLQSDNQNCGQCGHGCAGGTCQQGTCTCIPSGGACDFGNPEACCTQCCAAPGFAGCPSDHPCCCVG
jgi:hypothetical protein